MTPRRFQTNPPPQMPMAQPVRFYKVVALTFLMLTIILLGLVLFMSTKRATITVMTKATPVDVNTTIDIGTKDSDAALKGTITTTTVSLTELFEPTGTKEEPGKAEGTVRLHNDSNTDQPLVATTRLLTPEGILFRIIEGTRVPANGSVDVVARADKEGSTGNVGPSKFTIPGLNESRQKEVYATSEEPMKGGVRTIGILSNDDIKTAQKVLKEKLEQKGQEVLQENAKEGHESIFTVLNQTFSADKEIGDEIDGFNLTGNATVLGVFYKESELIDWAGKKLGTRAVDDSEIIEASKEKPTLTFEEYDKASQIVKVNVFSTGSAVLNPESEKLQKSIFFGKSKDEVRRYLLTLDHVNGVEVKLKPAWVGSVPHVADHVRVVVQNVQ